MQHVKKYRYQYLVQAEACVTVSVNWTKGTCLSRRKDVIYAISHSVVIFEENKVLHHFSCFLSFLVLSISPFWRTKPRPTQLWKLCLCKQSEIFLPPHRLTYMRCLFRLDSWIKPPYWRYGETRHSRTRCVVIEYFTVKYSQQYLQLRMKPISIWKFSHTKLK